MDTATLAELGAVPAEGDQKSTPPADNPNAGTEAQAGTSLQPDVLPEWTSTEAPQENQPLTPAAGAAMAAPGAVQSPAQTVGAKPAAPSPADLAELGAVPESHANDLGALPLTAEQAARDKNFDPKRHAESVDPDENPAGAANAQEFASQVLALRNSGVKPEGRTLGEQVSAAGGGLLQAGKTVAGQAVGTTKAIVNTPVVAALAAEQINAEAMMTAANQRGDKAEAAKWAAVYQKTNAEMDRIQAEAAASLELSGMAARKLVGTVLSPAENKLTADQQKFFDQKQLERHQQDLANIKAQLDADPTNPLLRDMVRKLTNVVAQDQVQAQKPIDQNAALNDARQEILNHVSEVAQRKAILAGKGEVAKGNIPGLPATATPEQLAAEGEKFNAPGAIESALGTTPVEAAAPAVDMLAYGPVFGATGRLLQLGGATRVGGGILGAGEKAADLAGAATRQVIGRTVQAGVSTPVKFAAGVATGGQFGQELIGGWLGKGIKTGAISQAAKDFAEATPGTAAGAAGDIVAGGVSRAIKAGAQGVVAGAPFIATSDDPAAAVGENFGFGLLFGMGGKGAQDKARALQNSRQVTAEGLHTLAQDPNTANVIGGNDAALQTAGLWQGILQRLDPRIKMRVLSADDFAAEAQKRDPNAQNADQARGFFDPATNEVVVNGTAYLGEVAGHEGGHALFGKDMAEMLPQVLQQKLADSVDAALLQPKKDDQGAPLGGQAAIGQPTPLLRQIAERYGKQLGRNFDLTNPADIEYLRNELIAETSRSLTSNDGDLAKFFSGPAAGQRGAEYLRDRLKDIFPRFAQKNFEFGFKEAPQVTQAVRASLYELGKIAREGTNQVNPQSEAADEAAHQQAEALRTPGTPAQETARADSIKALRALGYKASQAGQMVDAALASSEPTENSGQLTAAALRGANAGTGRTTPTQSSTMGGAAPAPAKPPGPTGPQVQVPQTVSFNDNSGSVPTQYRVVEAGDVEADPNNERPQAGSPAATQLQQRNAQAVQAFDPTKVINTSPSPSNGPPIVYKVMGPDAKWTGKYRIAGGHQRTDIIRQAGDKYTEALKGQGQAYDPEYDPNKVQQPLLVREIDAPADEKSRADLVRRLNDTETAGQDAVSNAVSAGRLLSDSALNHIATTASNPVGTPRANLLSSDTRELRADMVKSGIIRPQDMERMVAPDGRLTAEGVDLALDATVAHVLGADAATIRDAQRKAPGVLGKLETILPQILQAKARGVDIAPVAEAVQLEVARGGQSVADFQAQPPVVGPVPSREAMRIQQILAETNGDKLRAAFDALTRLTAPDEAGQSSMFAGNRQNIGDITDQELGQILGGERVTHDLTPRTQSPLADLGAEQAPVAAPEPEPAEEASPAPEAAPRQISTLTPRVSANLPVSPAGENDPSTEIQSTSAPQTRSITLPPVAPAVEEATKQRTLSPLGTEEGSTQPLEDINNHMPGLTTPSTESRSIWGRIKGMLPKFQGNKTVMGDYVVSAIRRYWTPEQRQAIRTIVDSFAGGGAWGFGLGETGLFPNIDRYIINEFDPHRAVRIRQQYENGDKFAGWAREPEVQAALQAIVDAAATRKGSAEQQLGFFDEPGYQDETTGNSWGGIVNDAVKILADIDPNDPANAKVIAVLKTMTDDPDRSGLWHGEEALSADALTRWFLKEHAPKAAAINKRYQAAVAKGVKFDFRQGDAYDPALYQGLDPKATMVVADPPYFGTTGYGNDEAAEGTKKKDIVGLDIYRKTRELIRQLSNAGHSVLYTDEAWWLKPDIGKNLTDPAMSEGSRMAADIANSLDLTVVDGKIDSRYETLGLHNGQAPRANATTAEAAPGEGAPAAAETRGAEPASPLAEPANAPAAEGQGGGEPVGGGRATEQARRPIHGPAAEPSPLAGPDLAETGPAGADRGPSPAGDQGQVGEEGERLPRGEEDQRSQAANTPVAPPAAAGGTGRAGERAAGGSGRTEESPLAGSAGESRQPSRSTVDAAAVRRAMDEARNGFDESSIKVKKSKNDRGPEDMEARRQRRIAEERDKAEAAPLLEALEQHARDNGIDPNEPHVGFLPAPEDPRTLEHQRKQLEDGRRMAMLYTPGEKEDAPSPGMARVETSNGVYHYNPKKILGAKVVELDRRGLQNLLLNLGPQNKAEIGNRPFVVVTERDPNGVEVRAAAATPDRAQATLEEMQRQATPGHKMAIEQPQDVLGRRPAFLPASTEASPLADRSRETDQGERYKGLTARTLATHNPETDTTESRKKYAGKFVDPADPLHKVILDHNGVDDETIGELNDSSEKGTPVMLGYGHAKAGDVVTAAGRKGEQKASPARERLQQANTAQVGDKVGVVQSFDVSQDGSLNVNLLDFDKYNQNATHLLDFMQEHLPEDAAKLPFNSIDDRAYQDAAKDYAMNHAHGYKGDGSAPLRPTADVPTGFDPSYKPRKLDKIVADFLNAAYGNTSAMSEGSAAGAQARELSKNNEAYPTTPEPLPDVNPLRARINAMVDADGNPLFRVTKADGTEAVGYKDVIEPVTSTLKAGLVDSVQPAAEALRDTGIRQVGEALSPFAEGPLPKGRFAAAGFLPKAEGKEKLDDLRRKWESARDRSNEANQEHTPTANAALRGAATRAFDRMANEFYRQRGDAEHADTQALIDYLHEDRSRPQFLPGRFDDSRRQEESPLADDERTDAMGTRSRDVTRPGERGTTLRFGDPVQPNSRLQAAEDNLPTKDYSNGSVTGPGAFFLPAFHGTGHKFDKFDISKIGSGEGAQVYGWGLYFASQKKTALEYRRNLSGGNKLEYDGKLYDRSDHSQMEDFVDKAMERIPVAVQEPAMEVLMDWSVQIINGLRPDYVEGVARGVAEEHDLTPKETEALVKGLLDVAAGYDGQPILPYAGQATSVLVPRFEGGKRAVSEADAATKIAWDALRNRIGTRNAEQWTQAKIESEIQRNIDSLQTRIDAGKLEIENRRKQKSGPAIGRAFDANAVLEGSQRDWTDALALLKSGKVKFQIEEPPGHHYEVDLKTDDDSLLDYDKPLSQQPASVEEKITEALRHEGTGGQSPELAHQWDNLLNYWRGKNGKMHGASFYQSLATRLVADKYDHLKSGEFYEKVKAEGPKLASEWLHAAGIDGIKYADGFTRNKSGAKTHNYVMFDDSKIEVKKRNERPLQPDMKTDEKGQGALFLPAAPKDSEEFKDWFGKSKMVDEKGEAKVYYHGTSEDFNRFNPDSFFTDDPSNASAYALGGDPADHDILKYDRGHVMPVFLKIEKPLEIDAKGEPWDAVPVPWDFPMWDKNGDLLPEFYDRNADVPTSRTPSDHPEIFTSTDRLVDIARKTGKWDGLVIKNVQDRADHGGPDATTVIPFKGGTQVKSATGNIGTYDRTTPDIRFLPQSPLADAEDGFYSQLQRVLEAKMPARATAAQVRGIIDPAKGSGVKPEEIKWSGLEDYLKSAGDKIDKEDLLAHIKEQAPKFGESEYNDQAKPPEWSRQELNDIKEEMAEDVMDQLRRRGGSGPGRDTPGWHEELRRRAEQISDSAAKARLDGDWYEQADPQYAIGEPPAGVPKFSQYVSPGGTNYREKVRTRTPQMGQRYRVERQGEGAAVINLASGRTEWNGDKVTDEQFKNLTDEYEKPMELMSTPQKFNSGHFSDAGDYIYHTRVSDAQDAEGQPGTLIHEIQSDRHQKARKEGYKEPLTEIPEGAVYERDGKWYMRGVYDPSVNFPTRQRAENYYRDVNEVNTRGQIPDAPFRKDWALQGFKDNLKDAVAAGHKWIGWDDGQTNADRYSLVGKVDKITWQPVMDELQVRVHPTGGGHVTLIVDKDGKVTQAGGGSFGGQADPVGRQLEDVIGKEVAERIMEPVSEGLTAKQREELEDRNEMAQQELRGAIEQMDHLEMHGTHLEFREAKQSVARAETKAKAAQAALDAAPTGSNSLSGEGLKIGGKGMIDFYDKILPAEVGKYVKKWGVKPEHVDAGAAANTGRFEVRGPANPDEMHAGMESNYFQTREQAEAFMVDHYTPEQEEEGAISLVEHPAMNEETKLPQFEEFTPADHGVYAGAEDWENGDKPRVGNAKILIDGTPEDVQVVLSGNGAEIITEGGESFGIYPVDLPGGQTEGIWDTADKAQKAIEAAWPTERFWRSLDQQAGGQARTLGPERSSGQKRWSVPITPEMAASVKQGQPRFLPGGKTQETSSSPLSDRVGPLTGPPQDERRRRRQAARQPRDEAGRFSPMAD